MQVSTYKYIENVLGNSNKNKFTSPHHSAQFHRFQLQDYQELLCLVHRGNTDSVLVCRVLVCGGADDEFAVQDSCWWWMPERDLWEAGPRMLYPRSEKILHGS